MIRRLRAQAPSGGTVEVDAVQIPIVRIARLPTAAGEVNNAALLIDIDDVADQPVAAGNAVDQIAGNNIVAVQMPPAVTLGKPDQLAAVSHDSHIDGVVRR